MLVDQNITQQLAALVAIVSVSIIGVAILLMSKIWKGFENTSVGLTIPERRLLNRILLLGFGPLLLFIFVTNFIGVCAPAFFQPVARSLFLLFLVIWRISGEYSNRSLSITIGTEADRRRHTTLQNISRFSITVNADRQDLDSYHLWPMSKDSMQDYWQHERFGVHYWHPTSPLKH